MGHFVYRWFHSFATQLANQLPQPHLFTIADSHDIDFVRHERKQWHFEFKRLEDEVAWSIEVYQHALFHTVIDPTRTNRLQLALMTLYHIPADCLHFGSIDDNAEHIDSAFGLVVCDACILSDCCYEASQIFVFPKSLWNIEV